MALRLGFQGKGYLNTGTYASPTWSEIGNIKDLSISLERNTADVTTRSANGWRLTVGVLADGRVEFQMVWDTEDTNFTAIKNAFFNNTTIDCWFVDGDASSSGYEGLRAIFSVTNFSRSENLEESYMVDVTLQPTYNTANSGSFVAPAWVTT